MCPRHRCILVIVVSSRCLQVSRCGLITFARFTMMFGRVVRSLAQGEPPPRIARSGPLPGGPASTTSSASASSAAFPPEPPVEPQLWPAAKASKAAAKASKPELPPGVTMPELPPGVVMPEPKARPAARLPLKSDWHEAVTTMVSGIQQQGDGNIVVHITQYQPSGRVVCFATWLLASKVVALGRDFHARHRCVFMLFARHRRVFKLFARRAFAFMLFARHRGVFILLARFMMCHVIDVSTSCLEVSWCCTPYVSSHCLQV